MKKPCPRCEENQLIEPIQANAISRCDNKTWICGLCGCEESFIDYLIHNNKRDEITETMKENEKRLAQRLGVEPFV